MASRAFLRSCFLVVALSAMAVGPAVADSSHARIVRLSLVKGDVRVARGVRPGQDPLADSSLGWEAAQLNLPMRQGYVLATDKGRAEVEFENGAMAFLSENTVLEFYDLSLEDGATNTRLVLEQGSATFYVNPQNDDYFSVTGGDFTAEATVRAEFRLDNFDDGSTVGVMKGRINVLRKKSSTLLSKGQSLTIRADGSSPAIGLVAEGDEFDHWVSGQIDSVSSATNQAIGYLGGSGYTAGFADLMTYGSWFPMDTCAGYGWRPYGYGLGWSPFDGGGWAFDPVFGWTFIGAQPWGWLPYHFGGWGFLPGIGWAWSSCGFGNGFRWLPSTGVFVRHRRGPIGVVPIHPLDKRGQTPRNLVHGVFPVERGAVGRTLVPAERADWQVVRKAPQETLTSNMIRTGAPVRSSRFMGNGPAGSHGVMAGRPSSIVYDALERKFVNANAPGSRVVSVASASGTATSQRVGGTNRAASSTGAGSSLRKPAASGARGGTPPSRVLPPPRARSSPGAGSYSGGGRKSSGGGSSGSVAHPSSGGSSSSHPSSGGRPH
jgi:uncharacterized protein DUF6600/FecR-like protein